MRWIALFSIMIVSGCIEAPASGTPSMPDTSYSGDMSNTPDVTADLSSADANRPPEDTGPNSGVNCSACEAKLSLSDEVTFHGRQFESVVSCPADTWVRRFEALGSTDTINASGFTGGCQRPRTEWNANSGRFDVVRSGSLADLENAGTVLGGAEMSICPGETFMVGVRVAFTDSMDTTNVLEETQGREFRPLCTRFYVRADFVDETLTGTVLSDTPTPSQRLFTGFCDLLTQEFPDLSCEAVDLMCAEGSVMTGFTHKTSSFSVDKFGIQCQPIEVGFTTF